MWRSWTSAATLRKVSPALTRASLLDGEVRAHALLVVAGQVAQQHVVALLEVQGELLGLAARDVLDLADGALCARPAAADLQLGRRRGGLDDDELVLVLARVLHAEGNLAGGDALGAGLGGELVERDLGGAARQGGRGGDEGRHGGEDQDPAGGEQRHSARPYAV